jgi:hypothetical protein
MQTTEDGEKKAELSMFDVCSVALHLECIWWAQSNTSTPFFHISQIQIWQKILPKVANTRRQSCSLEADVSFPKTKLLEATLFQGNGKRGGTKV